nr:MAG TPA: hypothetical protein [Bacteriophage sp.]
MDRNVLIFSKKYLNNEIEGRLNENKRRERRAYDRF